MLLTNDPRLVQCPASDDCEAAYVHRLYMASFWLDWPVLGLFVADYFQSRCE